MSRKAYPARGLPTVILCPNKGCNTGSNLEVVESAILEYLHTVLNEFRLKEHEKAASNQISNIENTIEILDKELSSVERQKERLFDLLEKEVYDIPTFTKRSETLKIKEEKLLQSKNEALDALKKEKSKDMKVIAKKIESILALYDSSTPQEKNELLKTVISRIEYYKSKDYKPNQFDLKIEFLNT